MACRWIAIYTESINWDEFALLARAERTVRLGEVVGGGRPGLATLLLIPFVRNCTDSVIAVVHARIAWQVFTLGYLAGVFVLVRRWFVYSRNGSSGTSQATLAVVLLAFLPAFVTWSVQVPHHIRSGEVNHSTNAGSSGDIPPTFVSTKSMQLAKHDTGCRAT